MICDKCEDSGYIIVDNKYVECVCQLENKVRKYLTHYYRPTSVQYRKNFNAEKYDKTNILIDRMSEDEFKSYVKSFLLNTGMKYKHATVDTDCIFHNWWTKNQIPAYMELQNMPFLIISLKDIIKNKFSAGVIKDLLEKRAFERNFSWIFCKFPVDSQKFYETYSKDTAEYIQNHFQRIITFPKK